MKIGILTFHCAHNYGAVLQSYALQQYLLNLGHKVEIIDYRPSYLIEPYCVKLYWWRFFSKKPIECLVRFFSELFYYLPKRYKRFWAFENFIKGRLLLSKPIKGREIPNTYDIYIVGSDQIWNSQITQGYDDVYFANFGFEKGNKKYITYAASMGTASLSERDLNYFKIALSVFDKISVRENSMMKILQPLTDKPIKHVLDPTLLLKRNTWTKLAGKPICNKRYVLVYDLGNNSAIIDKAKEIAKLLNISVLELTPSIIKGRNKYQTASPEKFLSAIYNADYVVTTSFHGTVFSVIFNIPFYRLTIEGKKDFRTESLLEKLNIKNRILPVNSKLILDEEINWNEVNALLDDYRIESYEFLNSLDNL